MGSYLERLCIFICLGDLLANFLPSAKFEKLYRCVAGVLILLLVIEPLGREAAMLLEGEGNSLAEALEQRLEGQMDLWNGEYAAEAIQQETDKMTEAYLEQLTEEEMAEELADYGYEQEDD